ncbi:MAG: Maf family protein [Desulfopila sp.]
MIYRTPKPLVLASGSPRRKGFLEDLGIVFSVFAQEIDETPRPNERPQRYVERMARTKGLTAADRFADSYVLAADTTVCLGETLLGKPATFAEAVDMLMSLAGRTHLVRSGFCIACRHEAVEIVGSVTTSVRFAPFSETTARAYVSEGESWDKAGGYGIQGKGSFLVEGITGSYSNVVGLPLVEVLAVLESQGVVMPVDGQSDGKTAATVW